MDECPDWMPKDIFKAFERGLITWQQARSKAIDVHNKSGNKEMLQKALDSK